MQTQGHVILNLAILGRRQHPSSNWPIMLGAFFPDSGLFGFYLFTRLVQGLSEREIWQTTYFSDEWQNFFGPFHSIPVALLGLGLALACKRWAIATQTAEKVALFCNAAILHCLEDLPLHHDDAHRHFWPLSDFRFRSPISYWDRNHHAVWGAGFELLLVLGASYWVWRRTRSRTGRVLLLLSGGLYLVGYATYFF